MSAVHLYLMVPTSCKVMIVAGEASGDLHAAKLVTALREASPATSFEFFGAAGERMRAAGVDAVVESDGLSIVGLAEIGRAMPMFLRAFSSLKRAASGRKPDVAVLVDFPDFNMKLAKSLKRQGLKVVYYISPQLWAWRRYRVRTIRNFVDLVISILPFEKDWYAKRGVGHVEYVGSPLAREVHPDRDRYTFCQDHDIDPGRRIVCLLPGSRHKEVVRILPVMLETAVLIERNFPSVQFIIAAGSEKNVVDITNAIDSARQLPANLTTAVGETFDALNAAEAAAVTSGTATLETAIIGTPMAIVYKTSPLNYKLLRPLIDVEHFGLVNLIAGERVAKELIQDDFTPVSLAKEIERLLDPGENRMMREKLRETSEKLGHGGASRRAAEFILKLISN